MSMCTSCPCIYIFSCIPLKTTSISFTGGILCWHCTHPSLLRFSMVVSSRAIKFFLGMLAETICVQSFYVSFHYLLFSFLLHPSVRGSNLAICTEAQKRHPDGMSSEAYFAPIPQKTCLAIN